MQTRLRMGTLGGAFRSHRPCGYGSVLPAAVRTNPDATSGDAPGRRQLPIRSWPRCFTTENAGPREESRRRRRHMEARVPTIRRSDHGRSEQAVRTPQSQRPRGAVRRGAELEARGIEADVWPKKARRAVPWASRSSRLMVRCRDLVYARWGIRRSSEADEQLNGCCRGRRGRAAPRADPAVTGSGDVDSSKNMASCRPFVRPADDNPTTSPQGPASGSHVRRRSGDPPCPPIRMAPRGQRSRTSQDAESNRSLRYGRF